MAECQHLNFECHCSVGRLTDKGDGPVTGYTAGIQIKCRDCGLPFRFIGLAAGNHYAEPRVSIDGTELRAPLEPATHQKFQPRAGYTMPPAARQ